MKKLGTFTEKDIWEDISAEEDLFPTAVAELYERNTLEYYLERNSIVWTCFKDKWDLIFIGMHE